VKAAPPHPADQFARTATRAHSPGPSPSAARVGRGRAHAAIGILNATATGIGCSLAITGGIEAAWTWTSQPGLHFTGPSDDHLASAVFQRLSGLGQGQGQGANVQTTSTFPPGRGLKTSSGAAIALVRAARDSIGAPRDDATEMEQAIQASRAAGVTLTGAFDDHVAARDGGCHLTDNRRRVILASPEVPSWHVAVWVPQASIPKDRLRGLDATVLAPELAPLPDLVRGGRIPEALTRSGAAFARFYAAAGQPVSQVPAQAALDQGALGAGLSGTGPAVAALFEARTDLPQVTGGTWTWARSVEASP